MPDDAPVTTTTWDCDPFMLNLHEYSWGSCLLPLRSVRCEAEDRPVW